MQGVKQPEPPIIAGYPIHVEARASGEGCGMNIKGPNKWAILTQNAGSAS
jgi:hypothetical protein